MCSKQAAQQLWKPTRHRHFHVKCLCSADAPAYLLVSQVYELLVILEAGGPAALEAHKPMPLSWEEVQALTGPHTIGLPLGYKAPQQQQALPAVQHAGLLKPAASKHAKMLDAAAGQHAAEVLPAAGELGGMVNAEAEQGVLPDKCSADGGRASVADGLTSLQGELAPAEPPVDQQEMADAAALQGLVRGRICGCDGAVLSMKGEPAQAAGALAGCMGHQCKLGDEAEVQTAAAQGTGTSSKEWPMGDTGAERHVLSTAHASGTVVSFAHRAACAEGVPGSGFTRKAHILEHAVRM